jgi:hypothetical protein
MAVTLNASTSSGFIQTADTSGELNLQSNGSTKLSVLSTGVSGTLVQGTAVASTSGTSIDFTSIPSWVKRITVMFSGVSTNGSSIIQIQLGSGSFTTSGYVSSGSNLSGSVSTTSSTTGLIIAGAAASGDLRSGSFVITNLNSNIWTMVGGAYIASGFNSSCAGMISIGGTLDRVRITTVNGTDSFDAGTINIQYEG